MLYAFIGLLFGLFVPYMARRIAKIMPTTLAYAMVYLCKPIKNPKIKNNTKYFYLRKKFRNRAFVWALLCASLSYAMVYKFGDSFVGLKIFFLWSLLLLAEIDYRTQLLPDIITVPLLIMGFVFAVMYGQWINVGESAVGAMVGYFLPVLASLFVVWKNPSAFGGGDVKLFAAVGAWLGYINLVYVMVGAAVIASIYALIAKKRSLAFGPAIVLMTIVVTFFNL